jgi:alanine racemase
MSAPARPEIVVDLAAIRHNVRTLADLVAGDGAGMMTIVKADGYGHGLLESGRAARDAGAEWLGVATVAEALALRTRGGDTGRLLSWLTLPADLADQVLAQALALDVDVTAYTVARLDEIVTTGESVGVLPRLQLKVDTGLSRGGAPLAAWADLVAAAAAYEQAGRAVVTGVWSHFACSDEPEHPANDLQERRFRGALQVAEDAGLRPEVRHLANSAAAILRPSSRFDLVRCGIASYGLDPAPGLTPDLGLRPAMTVRAPLALAKQIAAGEGVSYGHIWVAKEATTVGLVPVGYGDGVPRHGSNVLEVAVEGRRAPVRGRVCMDQFVVDLGGDLPPVDTDVVLFGPGDQGEPSAQDWAVACGTINYEIVTRMGGRLVRRHVNENDEGAPA